MRRALLIITLLALCACVKFHHHKNEKKNSFRRRLHKLRHFTQKQFEKFQKIYYLTKNHQTKLLIDTQKLLKR